MHPDIDQHGLREVLQEVLYEFNIQPLEKALVLQNNLREKIAIYLTCRSIDGLAKSTLEGYRLHLFKFANHIQKNLEDINVMDIRRHLASYSSTGVKTSTVQRKIAIFRSFFDWMENEEYILKSPMRKIKSLKLEKRLRKALTFEELEKIRDICNTYRERALLEFFYSTGCRLDEVVKLNKQDIDWQDLSTRVIGKGNKERTVFINAKAKVFLQKYLMSRLDDCEALFVTIRKPFRRMKRRAIEREISNIGKRIGLHIYPHLIRHTTATCMLHNGAELYEVQRVLGHEYPSTTQIYAQISDDSIKNAHRKYLAN